MNPQRIPNSAWTGFRADLASSAAAWGERPALPLTALAFIAGIQSLVLIPRSAVAVLALPILLFLAGFMGGQRLWFRRVLEGEPMGAREVWSSSWRYLGRFIRLGFVVGVVLSPIGPLAALSATASAIGALLATLAIDVVLTFVTPALAFTTRRVREALRIGWGMLRRDWKSVRWHALAPPLVIMAVGQIMPALGVRRWVSVPLAIAGWMASLLFKGAQAIPYLRAYPGHEGEPQTRATGRRLAVGPETGPVRRRS